MRVEGSHASSRIVDRCARSFAALRTTGKLKLLLQEKLLMTLGPVIEGGEDLEAALLVERPSLEGMRVEHDRVAVPLARIGLGLVHHLRCRIPAALGLIDPEIANVQPAAPDASQQAAHHLVAVILQ